MSVDKDESGTLLEEVVEYMIETSEDKVHLNDLFTLHCDTEPTHLTARLIKVANDYEKLKNYHKK